VSRWISLAALLVAVSARADGLAVESQAWFAIFTQIDLGHRLVAWGDVHARLSGDASRLSVLLRPGLGYTLRPGMVLWLGYAWTPLFVEGDLQLDEHRVWQQWSWDFGLPGGGRMGLRSRLEQRLAGGALGLRFRQFVRAQTALLGGGPARLAVWDEIFFAFNDTAFGQQAGFDQNRLFAGVALRVTAAARLEAGYFNQYVHRRHAADPFRHVAMVNLFTSF
jgi:hypothetical protein